MDLKHIDPPHRHTAILQASRQLYNEAVSILYAETTILMEAGDIFCLRANRDVGSASHNVWRHNPLHYSNGLTGNPKYQDTLLSGKMEPHVFARFQHIEMDVKLDLTGQTSVEIDENFYLDADDIKNYKSSIERTRLFKDLVAVLSNSPVLKKFTLDVGVEVDTRFPMDVSETEDEEADEKYLADER